MVQGWRFYTNSMGKIGKTDTGGFSMKLGFITSILDGWTYEQMMDFASEQGFECVEVACWPEEKAERRYAGVSHIDVANLDEKKAAEIKQLCQEKGVEISSLAYYPNTLEPDEKKRNSYISHLYKLVENSELNDEGRIAKLARRYKFDEHQLPWKDLNALGLDKETLFNNHCMGELLKGRITSTALPISKEINGEKKDLGEACFMCVKGADGKVELKTLTRLDKPQYDLPVYKGVFTDEEKDKLAETGTLGGIKEMKDTLTGNVCKCYVSFHESTNRIITMPVDAIKIPDYIYGKRLDDKQKQILASGGEVPINDIQRKNDTMLSGVAYVDPTIRDIAFKQSDKQLKVSDTILGAKITPEQKKILENHGMVFIENMRNPKTRQLFSDDVRFSNKSNNLLIGRNAREYKPAVENPKNDRKQETKQTARHVVSPRPQARKNSLSFS